MNACNPEHNPASVIYDSFILELISINQHTKREMHSLPIPNTWLGSQNLKWVTWPWLRPFLRCFVTPGLQLTKQLYSLHPCQNNDRQIE